MPIYAYRCTACGHAQDVLQKISDPLLTTCPVCGAEAYVKQLTAAGFQLKGSGWYVTDFRGGDKKPGGKDEGQGDAKSDGASDGKGDVKSDAKPSGDAAKPASGGAASDASSKPASSAPAPASAPAASAAPAPPPAGKT